MSKHQLMENNWELIDKIKKEEDYIYESIKGYKLFIIGLILGIFSNLIINIIYEDFISCLPKWLRMVILFISFFLIILICIHLNSIINKGKKIINDLGKLKEKYSKKNVQLASEINDDLKKEN